MTIILEFYDDVRFPPGRFKHLNQRGYAFATKARIKPAADIDFQPVAGIRYGRPDRGELRYLVYIQFMNFPVITGIQAFGHTQNDPFAAIGEHDHLAGSLIEGDAFNFPDLAQFV